jgi:LysM repeat protein
VKGITPSLYLVHKVQPKETWYSIGRLYNISPKEIAPFNNTDINKGLGIGQEVKIPLVAGNFTQDGDKAADEVLVPVQYLVKEGEWMFRVSANNNKVPLEKLEEWNKINRNQVKAGMNLVVGFLKVKKDQSALAGRSASDVAVTPKAPAEIPKETKPINSPTESRPPNEKPATVPVFTPAPATTTSVDHKGGYFRSQYENGGKSARGVANIFRSTSGWDDGKYYALMDNVPVGTIVMVSNPSTNKAVYAKVLGNLSDIKENAGLSIRISNAAAAELGSGESKFTAEIRY